jgi:hypothetical protein
VCCHQSHAERSIAFTFSGVSSTVWSSMPASIRRFTCSARSPSSNEPKRITPPPARIEANSGLPSFVAFQPVSTLSSTL